MRLLYPLFIISLSVGSSVGARADLKEAFPEPADVAGGFAALQSLDLGSESVTLSNSKGGTSVYAVVSLNGKTLGAFIPPNSSSDIDGEAAAYSLARILNVAESVQPGALTSISGTGFAKVRDLILHDARPGEPAKNAATLISWMNGHPGAPLPGVLKYWHHRPYDFDELVKIEQNTMNTQSPFARYIRADGPAPTSNSIRKTAGKITAANTELALARELSTHLLIDALIGQWDRFSGGNLQIFADGSILHFALYDNGGAWGGPNYTNKSLSFVSRFDRLAATRLHEMNDFLNGRGEFYGAANEAELQDFIQLSGSRANWRLLKQKLALVVKAIDAVPESPAKYF